MKIDILGPVFDYSTSQYIHFNYTFGQKPIYGVTLPTEYESEWLPGSNLAASYTHCPGSSYY